MKRQVNTHTFDVYACLRGKCLRVCGSALKYREMHHPTLQTCDKVMFRFVFLQPSDKVMFLQNRIE